MSTLIEEQRQKRRQEVRKLLDDDTLARSASYLAMAVSLRALFDENERLREALKSIDTFIRERYEGDFDTEEVAYLTGVIQGLAQEALATGEAPK